MRRTPRGALVCVVMAVALAGLDACVPADAITTVAGYPGMHTQTITSGTSTYSMYWRDTTSTTRGGVMLVHGGAWTGGDRGRFTSEAQHLADSGYVAATIDYRLADGTALNSWPAQQQSALAAWRVLRDHAAIYHLDTGRLAIGGESAGGHIVLATVEAMLPTERPSAVVSWSGPTDLGELMTNPQPTCSGGGECYYYNLLLTLVQTRLLRCSYAACAGRYSAASPARHLTTMLPPTMQTFFARDIVPGGQGSEMDAALRGRGGVSVLNVYPGFGHGATWTPQVWADSVDFLSQYMGTTGIRSTHPGTDLRQGVTRVPLSELVGQ